MPREFSRGRRVADLIQEELARLLSTEIKDPRIGMVTINDVKVSRDLAWADVYFTMMGGDGPEAAEEELGHAAGFLRSELARALSTRTTPRLRFHYDHSIEYGDHMSRKIAEAISADKKHPGYGESDTDEGNTGKS
ncbi:MAG: 30S ribosome-binding factor RbfA [Pseudomonadales bacterium]|nr:30S ribosome-binding factor RbfA [Pseudomonadales bacterium]